ncbi:MAG: hypothetical protein K8L91_02505 [Anaerolineae bacterium]|nr:hypothetical protein [Anaerolineae bacterium]
MVIRFADHSNRPNRALQAWLILIGRARNRQTLTYTMLDELMGFGAPRALGPVLDYLWKYCKINNLPPLTVLVVNKTTGTPSSGMGDFNFAEQEAVFDFDWYSIFPPTPEELDTAAKQI